MCSTLESTLSSKELFLEQAFPGKYVFPARKYNTPHAFRHCCQRFLTKQTVATNNSDCRRGTSLNANINGMIFDGFLLLLPIIFRAQMLQRKEY